MKDLAPPESARVPWLTRLRATVLGLQCKATVLVVGLLTVIAVVLCGLTVGQAWRLTNQLESEQALQRAMTVAQVSADAVQRLELGKLQRLVDELVTGDPLWFLYITNRAGELLAWADRTPRSIQAGDDPVAHRQALMGVPVVTELPEGGTKYVDVTYPISANTGFSEGRDAAKRPLLGYVHLGMNRSGTIAEFDAAADLAIGIGMAIVMVSIPVGFMVVRRIVEPLNEMTRVAQRFSAGNLQARSTVRRSDEIGILARNLNEMADEIAHKHQQVVRLNAELEQRVMERTAQLRELASREPLTGLYNRRHFSEVLSRRFAEAQRYGMELSLMMLDLDDFKAVNDQFGHQAGDELLVITALTVSSQLRAADVAARFGGDEFIVLLPHSDGGQARILGERIVKRFNKERREKLPHISANLSIGIANLAETDAETDEDFIRAADGALYEAKALGKNRIVSVGTAVQ